MKKRVLVGLLTVCVLLLCIFSLGWAETASTDPEASVAPDAVAETVGEDAVSDVVANRAITFEEESYVAYKGKELKIKAVVENLSEDAPKTTQLVWESSDPEIAKVAAGGAVTVKAPGEVTITASAKDDPSISASVKVEARMPVSSVKINEKAVTVLVGTSKKIDADAKLTVTVAPEDAFFQTGTWTSSKEDIATVDASGLVHGVSAGTATITFTSDDPNGKKAQVQVKVNQAVTSIALSDESVNIPISKSATVKAVVEPANAANKKLEWTSDDETIATVSATGQITGKGVGKTVIHATALDGSAISESCNVEIVQPVKKIDAQEKKITLPVSISKIIEYTVEPENATLKDIQWNSSNEKIATVNEQGQIYGVSNGKCNITGSATDGSNVKLTIAVTVKNYDVIFTDRWAKNVDFPTTESESMFFGMTNYGPANFYEVRRVKFKNGCVQSSGENQLVPIKAGEDTVTVTIKRNGRRVSKKTYSVYVAPSAFEVSESDVESN